VIYYDRAGNVKAGELWERTSRKWHWRNSGLKLNGAVLLPWPSLSLSGSSCVSGTKLAQRRVLAMIFLLPLHKSILDVFSDFLNYLFS
jgi:hypothetical protein